MEANEFSKHQYLALRSEIEGRQSHLFWIVLVGAVGLPVITYFASGPQQFLWVIMPYFTLLLILAFIAEQHAMMRAGRFIREHIEKECCEGMAWEQWLESNGAFRRMEAHFFAGFIVVFFLFYFMSVGMAMQWLWTQAGSDPSGQGQYWLYGAVVTYIVGAVWGFSTLLHHWHAAVSTTD
ncbi:MAG: hypothetical protein DHS20C16_08440 [Phycisphaerae bacterium]|nr:MAG: hypothetical protein DHS20C16_08440 [Phycisphaerae bacterium]